VCAGACGDLIYSSHILNHFYVLDIHKWKTTFCLYCNFSVLKYIIMMNINIMSDDYMMKACIEGDLDKAKLYVKNGCDPRKYDDSYLHFAVRSGDTRLVKFLISQGCDPKSYRECAIRWAAMCGHLVIVKYLCEQGCDPRAENDFAIKSAYNNGHYHVVKYLIKRGVNWNNNSL